MLYHPILKQCLSSVIPFSKVADEVVRKHGYKIKIKILFFPASYSKPVITGPVQLGEEMMFMCNSSHGYPEQRLYWVNEMDNSTMNVTVQFIKELDGSFSVFSTLKMKMASDIKLGCIIEHKQLHQNITTTSKLFLTIYVLFIVHWYL